MSAMAEKNVPSIEEVLESIRNVMEREGQRTEESADTNAKIPGQKKTEPIQETETADPIQKAMNENLRALSRIAESGPKPTYYRAGETCLEELVKAMLQPMLTDWLDRNLPRILGEVSQKKDS